MANLNDELMGQLFDNAHKQSRNDRIEKPPVRDDLTEEEALKIYNDLLDVIVKAGVSYKNACRLTTALAEAFLQGAVDLYEKK